MSQPKLRIKKGDLIKVISGAQSGKTGKVIRTDALKQLVFVDGIGIVKRKVKPSQINPRGGTREVHVGLNAGKVALVADEKATTTTRLGFTTNKAGKKVRIAKKTGKEI